MIKVRVRVRVRVRLHKSRIDDKGALRLGIHNI